MHGLAIVKVPGSVKGGVLEESTLLAKGKDLGGGEGSDRVTATLKAGSYELSASPPAITPPGSATIHRHRLRTTITTTPRAGGLWAARRQLRAAVGADNPHSPCVGVRMRHCALRASLR
jgi:hypothetical protein